MEQALKQIIKLRDDALKSLNGKVNDFLLGGGTALSLFYLRHRESFDLDFFTKDFSERRVKEIISVIEDSLKVKIMLKGGLTSKKSAKMLRCYVQTNDKKSLDIDGDKNSLKIDFLEDVYYYIPSYNTVIEGIPILSQENIYLRKIYASCGTLETQDNTGRKKFVGGRQEAKDLFDLYFLSKDFMRLSKFVAEYCPDEKEKIIIWHHSYQRKEMKLGISELITNKEVDFHNIERHFRLEIRDMIKQEL